VKRTVRVFIGSSSENLEVVDMLGKVLSRSRRKTFKIEAAPWHKKVFELSRNYIESLENELNRADLAIFELTPNDITQIRGEKKLTPRDNVVFELGLFMGRLHRNRCIMLYDRKIKTKLPSDLLGVKAATYDTTDAKDLGEALAPTSRKILDHVVRILEGPDISSFIAQIEGAWWERIRTKNVFELSFFTIRPVNKYQSIEMEGQHYDHEGILIGRWKAVEISIRHHKRELFYHWEGGHPPTKQRGAFDVEGFGSLEFNYATGNLKSGKGKFTDIDPNNVVDSQWKWVRLKRISNRKHITTMSNGNDEAKKLLVKKIIKNW